jgi:hypothetical protein
MQNLCNKKKWHIILLGLFFFQYCSDTRTKVQQNPNQARLDNIKKNVPDNLKHLLSKIDSIYKSDPNSKFPAELDFYFRKFVPDSLKYLLPILDTVFEDDQRYRENSELELLTKHRDEIRYLDSVNIKKIIPIIERYGILSPKEIGLKGSSAIFMTLQHASLSVQTKYLPLIEESFKNKKITAGQYAMYVDRVALHNGKMQLYGTQVRVHSKGDGELEPVFDVDNLDKRRDSIGIGSIEKYLKIWDIKWDIEQYKKNLPMLKERYKIR